MSSPDDCPDRTALDDCPERPNDESELGFEKKPMVRWFNPVELVRTGTEALLSSLFGAYADWREVQALHAHDAPPDDDEYGSDLRKTVPGVTGGHNEWYDLSERDDLWIDYTADLGDGFAPTHTVARLLAERHLPVGGEDTERGRLLVMGGDQVYPAASRTAYQNRLTGPYEAALPCVTDETPPALFAVPGNHDWYDGLTSFLRLFTQNRWIGGWRTHQRRSYFAIKLPHDWWLWGIDVQLDSDIDEPQLNYFRSIATNESVMPEGSRVILCTPEPTWVFAETKGPDAYHNLGYFQDEVLSKHELKVGLAGDLHTYARYASDDTGEQRFIAGGGGAYLYPTHDLPDTLEVETPDGREARFELQRGRDAGNGDSVFPDRTTSRRLTWNAVLLPFQNGGLGASIAGLYLLFAWLLESSAISGVLFPTDGSPTSSLLGYLSAQHSPAKAISAVLDTMAHTPSATLLALVLLGGLFGFADVKNRFLRLLTGLLHTAAHLLLATILMWGAASLNADVLNLRITPIAAGHVLLLIGEILVAGGVLGGTLIGLYLVLMNRLFGVHTNEVFSCQHIPHYKNVLRLHVDDGGKVTMYPIGVPTVETNWQVRSQGAPQDPWFAGEKPPTDRAELIEAPIRVQ